MKEIGVSDAVLGTVQAGQSIPVGCLLYTSDAADDLIGVDLGGRLIKKKKKETNTHMLSVCQFNNRGHELTLELRLPVRVYV